MRLASLGNGRELCGQKRIMFSLNENNNYQVYTLSIDMRKGIEGLCGIVRSCQCNPTDGRVYVFANRSRTLLKMLHWERGGYVIYYKRMEQGRLSRTMFSKEAPLLHGIRWDELVLLVEGIRTGVKRRKRYNI